MRLLILFIFTLYINVGNCQNGKQTKQKDSNSGSILIKTDKVSLEDWILDREPSDKFNLISWLIDGCYWNTTSNQTLQKCKNMTKDDKEPPEFQSFDGFFNNLMKVDLGGVDTPLYRKIPPVYADGVYQPASRPINPFVASQELMMRTPECFKNRTSVACRSKTGKSAFLVYFGQQVVEEILDAQRPGCPPEYFNIPIPEELAKAHGFHKTEMPFLRSRYSQQTGHSPSNPRQQLNEITPWIDGGLIYGTSKGWADTLRRREDGTLEPHGKLASHKNEGLFPSKNNIRLPLANPPPPFYHNLYAKEHKSANVKRFFVLGNPRGNENAFLLTFGVVLFRWHNHIATYLHESRPFWNGERVFNEARKWVIATYQQIAVYNWLTEWLGEELDEYKGYDPTEDPQIEQFFQTAAMRFGHTLVTPGSYMRDYACNNCKLIPFNNPGKTFDWENIKHPNYGPVGLGAIRTCNIFWRPQEPLEQHCNNACPDFPHKNNITDIDRLLMGMASTMAEREDNMIVEDLRGRVFGPLEFSRRDLMAINIQRGRDHGTPDYNTAREAFNLPRINSVDEFFKETQSSTNRSIIEKMVEIHRPLSKIPYNEMNQTEKNASDDFAWRHIDVWTGGILETKDRPGQLFRTIIKDQFTRIRNADRFWFENTKWNTKRFTDDEIKRIKALNVFDLVVSVTRMKAEDIQANPFRVPTEKDFGGNGTDKKCHVFTKYTPWISSSCRLNATTELKEKCYHFPQLDSPYTPVDNCSAPGSYDYFDKSDWSFIITFLTLGLVILAIVCSVPMIASCKAQERKVQLVILRKELRKSIKVSDNQTLPVPAREWQSNNEGSRPVVVIINKEKPLIEILNHEGQILRILDFTHKKSLNIILINDGLHLILKNPTEYDCVLKFEGRFIRESFIRQLKEKDIVEIHESSSNLKPGLSGAITKEMRLARLEFFMKAAFNRAQKPLDPIDHEKSLKDPKVLREIIHMELTRAEFADALGIHPHSTFVEKMFDLVDKDRSGSISFREFLDMLVVFAKGTAEEKARLMFEMYDITKSGYLSPCEFKLLFKSMIEAATGDTKMNAEDLDELVLSLLQSIGLNSNSSIGLKDFQRILSRHEETLENAHIKFPGAKGQGVSHVGPTVKKHRDEVRAAVFSIYGGDDVPLTIPPQSQYPSASEYTMKEQKRSSIITKIEIFRLQLFWALLYIFVVLGIFLERAHYYSFEREHNGLRHIAGYGVTITRGAASVMMFTYSTLLLAMCRNGITYLRETRLRNFIPFDSFVSLHKFIAIIGFIFTVIHVVGHAFNFYHISTQTSEDLTCLFREYHRPTHVLPKFHYWMFGTVTGISGLWLVIHLALIYIFATKYARTHAFRMFSITHSTYPIFYIMILIHGSGRLVQEPLFGNFLIGPLTLYIFDSIIAITRKKVEIPVIRADILPSNVTKLEFARPRDFEYKSGQWVRIACLKLNPSEFHPFTLSSAPHEPYLTLHIRAVGPFTANIRKVYQGSLPKLYLDGPYGEGHQDWWRYEVSVLIGGGIGVTPFASILKDVSANKNPRNCKKIYFIWVTKTQKQFEWLVDIIRESEKSEIISVHVFITQLYDKFDLRTVLLYICERHFQKVSGRSLFTGLRSVTHFGRPNFVSFLRSLRIIHPNVSKFGVFSCGVPTMTKKVDEACGELNIDNANSTFEHHAENF